MSDQSGGSPGMSRGVRTLEQQVQNPYTPETALVEQAPVIYDINTPARLFRDGVEIAPDGTVPEGVVLVGEDDLGSFVESKGQRFNPNDLALIDRPRRSTVLADDSEHGAPGLLQPVGTYFPTQEDQAAAESWAAAIWQIAEHVGISQEKTIKLTRELMSVYAARALTRESGRCGGAGPQSESFSPEAFQHFLGF
jgi:hypothetical protein